MLYKNLLIIGMIFGLSACQADKKEEVVHVKKPNPVEKPSGNDQKKEEVPLPPESQKTGGGESPPALQPEPPAVPETFYTVEIDSQWLKFKPMVSQTATGDGEKVPARVTIGSRCHLQGTSEELAAEFTWERTSGIELIDLLPTRLFWSEIQPVVLCSFALSIINGAGHSSEIALSNVHVQTTLWPQRLKIGYYKNNFEELPKRGEKVFVSYDHIREVVVNLPQKSNVEVELLCSHFKVKQAFENVSEINLADLALANSVETHLPLDPRVRHPYQSCRFVTRSQGINAKNEVSPFFYIYYPLPTVTAEIQGNFSTFFPMKGARANLINLIVHNTNNVPVTLKMRRNHRAFGYRPTYYVREPKVFGTGPEHFSAIDFSFPPELKAITTDQEYFFTVPANSHISIPGSAALTSTCLGGNLREFYTTAIIFLGLAFNFSDDFPVELEQSAYDLDLGSESSSLFFSQKRVPIANIATLTNPVFGENIRFLPHFEPLYGFWDRRADSEYYTSWQQRDQRRVSDYNCYKREYPPGPGPLGF